MRGSEHSNDIDASMNDMNKQKFLFGLRAMLAACFLCASLSASAVNTIEARIAVDADKPGPRIDPDVYGQFVEHLGRGVYEGIWVGENSPIPNVRGIRSDVVAALRRIHVPLVRWPGGCFGEIYHWRDGVGPRASRGSDRWRRPRRCGPRSRP